MRRAIHFGVSADNVPIVRDLMKSHGHHVHVDGDGWESWGEKPGTDVNDADTLHCVIYVDYYAYATIELLPKELLRRMLTTYQRNTLIVVSDPDTWSETQDVILGPCGYPGCTVAMDKYACPNSDGDSCLDHCGEIH